MTLKTFVYYFLGISVIAIACLLRMTGIQFGLPDLYHADEPIVVNHALAYASGDLNPHFFRIPPLISYLLFGCYGILYLLGKVIGLYSSVRNYEIEFYRNPTLFYLIGRILFGAVLGAATVCVWLKSLAKYFGKRLALMTALFLAVSVLHVRDSHYLYADIPLVLVMVLFFNVLFGLAVPDPANDSKRLIGLGFLMGLATAVKYNGCFLMIPFVYMVCASSINKSQFIKNIGIAAITMAIIYGALNPFSIMDVRYFVQELMAEGKAHGGSGWMHHVRYSLAEGIGWPLLGFGLLGLFKMLFRWEPKRGSMFVFVVSYYAIIALWGQDSARYALPVLPFLLFFSADSADFATRWIRPQRVRDLTTGILVCLLIWPTGVSSLNLCRLLSQDDTRTETRKWVMENVETGEGLALDSDFFLPRLNFSQEQLEEKKREAEQESYFSSARIRKLEYLLSDDNPNRRSYRLFFFSKAPADIARPLFSRPVIPYSFEPLIRYGIHYVLTARTNHSAEEEQFLSAVSKTAVLIKEFNPYQTQHTAEYDPFASTGLPLKSKELNYRKRCGPLIKIYRLRSE